MDRVIGAPNTIKHYFITNPDYTEDPFKTSMKTGIIIFFFLFFNNNYIQIYIYIYLNIKRDWMNYILIIYI